MALVHPSPERETGMSFNGTGTGNEGTDSTSTDPYDIGTIPSHFH